MSDMHDHQLPESIRPYEGYRPDEEMLTKTWAPPKGLIPYIFTPVNHRIVGLRFIFTAFIFLILGGILALLMRAQLAAPELDLISAELFQQLFSMHGATMMFFFAVPMFEGLGIYLVPLMIGTRDMAFPRLGAYGYWVYVIAGVTLYVGLFIGHGADAGWFAHAPLSSSLDFTPKMGMDFWVTAVGLLEISALTAAIELVVTIFKMRAPGMALSRMPIFVWAILIMSFMIIFAMPAVLLATITVGMDRMVGTHFFDVLLGGDPVLYKHIFWFFGHPEVYIIFTPALGVIATVIVTFARVRLVAYSLVALSLISMGVLSFGVWAHHFFAVGLPPIGLSFFAAASTMVSIPSGIQIFSFLATTWQGRLVLKSPFFFLIGFFITFILGGVTGVMLAVVPFNWQVHDSYFVVAHLHYVLIGGAVFPLFAGLIYWFPKFTGKMMDERLAMWSFGLMFVGFHLTFFIQHALGFMGMSRRIYTYSADLGLGPANLVSTIGAFVLALGILVFIWNALRSYLRGDAAGENPWRAPTLEWDTSSPPKQYNFLYLPVVHDRYPLWAESEIDPEGDTAAARGIRARPQIRDDVREAFGTSLMDAEPESRVNLVSPTPWPFLAAVATGIIFIGAMFTLWSIPIGALLFYFAMIGWHWPFNKELAS